MSAPPPVNSSQTARQNAAKQGAAALAAQQAQQAAQRANIEANDTNIRNGTVNRGFGNGRITFDNKGDVLIDGKLPTTLSGDPLFSTVRNETQYLRERGIADTGQIVNAAVAAKSDFSEAPTLEQNLQRSSEYQNAQIEARNESPELVFSNGQIKQKNPNRLNPVVNFGDNKPVEVTNISFIPKGAGSNISADSVFSAKTSPSKNNNSEAEAAFGAGRNTSGIKNSFLIDKSYGQRDLGQNIRNTQAEADKQASEADRAASSFGYSNDDNSIYNLWTNQKTPTPRGKGGIETPQSIFLESKTNYGQVAKGQNVRNSSAESALMISEANRALQKEQTENVSFTSFNQPTKANPKVIPSRPKEESSPFLSAGTTGDVFPARELSFNDYLTTNANKGATIDIIEGGKTVGSFQGTKAISGVQAYEKAHPDESFSISAYFPEREKALTEAVQSNPSPFLNQPQGFWIQAAKNGYLSQNNAQKIQNTLYLESAIENRESLAGFRGTSSQYLYETTDNGQAVSLGRFPFSGGKTYSSIIGSLGLPNRAQNKTSSQEVPSTSLANFLIFTPTFGNSGIKLGSEILEDILGQGAKAVAKAPKFKLTDLGEAANSVKNPIVRKVVSPFISSPKLEDLPTKVTPEATYDITPAGRTRATFRNTNPTRTQLPSDIISNDNSKGLTPFSETPKPLLPVNSDNLRSAAKAKIQQNENQQNQNEFFNLQSKILTSSKTVNNNPPASTNIPFFAGRVNAQGKQLAGNKAPLNLISPSSNEAVSVSGKTASIAPISTFTAENSGLSPISRESFAPQFTGVYPQSYLPPSFVVESQTEQPDIYSNAGEGIFDASTFRNNAPTNYKEFEIKQKAKKVAESNKTFGFLIKQQPLVPIRVKNAIGQYYKESSPFDFIQQPRAERVENRVFYEYPFSSSGKRLTISQAAQEGPLFGALRPISPKPEIENKPQGPKPLTRSSDIIGKYALTGKGPIEKYAVKFSQPVSNPREFFGLAGEKISKSSGLLSGNEPLSNYGFTAQQGFREGDIVGINSETGAKIRIFQTKPEITGRTGPKDIWSDLGITGKSEFPNAKGGKYYTSSPVYEYGNTFPRGSLQNKDVGLIKFEKFQEKQPIDESKMGDKRFNQDVLRFKQSFSKAGIFTPVNPKEVKGLKFKSTSNKVLDFTKPKETKNDVFFKSNTSSSKSETVLVKKPLQKKSLISDTSLANDYDYSFARTPPSRETNLISTTQKGGVLSGLKFASILSPKQSSKSSLDIFSKNGLGLKDFNIFSGKLGQDLFPKQNTRQTPKQVPDILQTPRQGQKPKQTSKQKMNPPQIPRQRQSTSNQYKAPKPYFSIFEPPVPPKVPLVKPNFSNWNVKGNGKGKSGPTALENLPVFNVFSSSFNITVEKGKRFEF